MFLLYTAVASAIFGVLVTRPSIRILTQIWPLFFTQVESSILLGLEDGFYDYQETSYSQGDEQKLELESLFFFIKVSVGLGVAVSWLATFLLGTSLVASLLFALLGNLLPLSFGLGLIGIGKHLLHRRGRSIGSAKLNSESTSTSEHSPKDATSGSADEPFEAGSNPLKTDTLLLLAFGAACAQRSNDNTPPRDLANAQRLTAFLDNVTDYIFSLLYDQIICRACELVAGVKRKWSTRQATRR